MNYTIETIADFCSGKPSVAIPGYMVRDIIIDHREPNWKGALFVAIQGTKVDGHTFIPALIKQGVRNFLITKPQVAEEHKGLANFILVTDIVQALQDIAAEHRDNFKLPVVSITGSNGKTIVKEWLNMLLEGRHRICRSPKSFNSQIGVALSVAKLERKHTLGVFEAGISKPMEMEALERMIKPTIGVLTNIGDAHAAHFESSTQKLEEKLKLFKETDQIVCSQDQQWCRDYEGELRKRFFTWSRFDQQADVFIELESTVGSVTNLKVRARGQSRNFRIPFSDKASIENAMQCFCVLQLLGLTGADILKRFELLSPVAMRMEVKQGIENSVLIDDSYNSDIGSLAAALEQLSTQKGRTRMVILTDMSEKSDSRNLYARIAEMVEESGVEELVAIGPDLEKHRGIFSLVKVDCFPDTDTFWNQLDHKSIRNKAILVKGARRFKLEQLVKRLQAQQHETKLEVDLHKLGENLKYFRSKVEKEVKLMVMVKAFGYGSGGFEVANYLQNQKVDYLSVAYADEGVDLRKKGIYVPIMVMSPAKSAYESIIKNKLEPEIYSMRSLREFVETAKSMRHLFENLLIHIKIDSGMHRLGFEQRDLDELAEVVENTTFLKVASIFTHLSAADNQGEDAFTSHQMTAYLEMAHRLEEKLGYTVDKHALNSSGALRFPEYHLDMVRIGIGLYGFVGTEHSKFLHALGVFKSYIIQIRSVAAAESVGYNRGGANSRERRIATVAVGYADGLDRRLSDGRWSLKWQDQLCPIVGNVCMDMCMIDVTHCSAQEGDEVVVFEGSDEVERMARLLDTIPYEILTKISHRVRRVYLQE